MSECICYISEGKITNPEMVRKRFGELKDGVYQVTIKIRRQRSIAQNAYYWGVVCDMVKDGLKDAGFEGIFTAEDAHEVMKSMFLKRSVYNQDTGEVLAKFGRSTANLSTIEFIEYIERIIQWAAEYLGINVPYPNEEL